MNQVASVVSTPSGSNLLVQDMINLFVLSLNSGLWILRGRITLKNWYRLKMDHWVSMLALYIQLDPIY